jgi:regulatory protein
MKITKITQQAKQRDRYSIFVDEKYAFSLSEQALLDSKLNTGLELTKEQVTEYKQLSADDKLLGRTLRWIAMRPRSVWETEFYLKRKDASPEQIEQILNKLSDLGFLDDLKFAEAFVRDRRTLRSMSSRRLQLELKKKHVSAEVIDEVLAEDETDESAMLRDIIIRKRQQTKYREDEMKLMQYLARQGFSYGDIKDALSELKED